MVGVLLSLGLSFSSFPYSFPPHPPLIHTKLTTPLRYCFQGGGKYGFYEVFKYSYGERLFPNVNKTAIFLGASASAEFLADIALCPFEALKVRMQTTLPPFAPTLRAAWSKVVKEEGYGGFVTHTHTHTLSLSPSEPFLHPYHPRLQRSNPDAKRGLDYTKDSTPSGRAKSPTRW